MLLWIQPDVNYYLVFFTFLPLTYYVLLFTLFDTGSQNHAPPGSA
jgi:hypothetical protein